ncbi:DUF6892 domain-containing protein [Streptomyces erythrochromogenes]|uniref:DUF6892 domain-containing protein n=1 Tax=Streptomyces erythrochromogenes TaxID=285574 RepID=UPI00380E7CE9
MTAFRDFNLKLLVVEKLMYWDGRLTPPFSLRAHMTARGIGDLDAYVAENDLEYTVLDDARAPFEALEIPAELLATVEELTFDGGPPGLHGVRPGPGGGGRPFDVRRLDDLALLPDLKLFTGVSAPEHTIPGALEPLCARGIEARYQPRRRARVCSRQSPSRLRRGLPP